MESYFPAIIKQNKSSQVKAPDAELRVIKGCDPDAQNPALATSVPVSPLDLTNKLLGSLTDPTNPITHSNIVERTEFYVPFATGHQVAEQPNGRQTYMAHREDKLHIQQENTQVTCGQSSNIFKGVKVFISGYLASTTDTEVKRLVMQSGGRVVSVASQCTHIISSRGLNGFKTHKIQTRKGSVVHVVKPEWIVDSLSIGKRQPERRYTVLRLPERIS